MTSKNKQISHKIRYFMQHCRHDINNAYIFVRNWI